MAAQLLLQHVKTPSGVCADILVDAGRIVRIAPDLPPSLADTRLDAEGHMAAPGFVNAHIHPAQTFVGGPWVDYDYADTVPGRAKAEAEYLANHGRMNSLRNCYVQFREAIRRGTTHVRGHIDVGVFGLAELEDVARAAVAVRAASGKPVIVVSNISGGIDPAIGDILAQGNVPVVQGSGAGIPAIRRWIDWCAARAAKTASPYPRKDSPTPSILPPELASELDASSGVLPYALSARLLRHFGIAIDHEELAVSLEEGMAAAGRIGYPVALKAASPDIAHKTETGLVKLNLRTGAEFAAAWRELEGILALHHADARREGMLVQGMVRSAGGKSGDVVETIVGVNRDGGFGSAVMVGLGGVFVELLRDVSLELAPLSPEGARAMIGRLKAAKLLTGFRGRAASDVEALSDVLVRVAAMCCALGDRLVSLDLNPVMVLPEGEGVRIVDIVMQVAPARHCGETD